jgi:DNA-binding NtrC family response regulator
MPNTISVRVATPRAVGRALPAVLVGESGAVRRARASIDDAGPGSVLILADDGLEPASVARYLHGRSRAGQPFVEIDCAQGSAEDIEAVLLGNRPRAGSGDLETVGAASAVLAARRGTLFIDHLGDLPAIAQQRIARILRDGEVRTNGRDRVRMAARIVAAATPSLVSDARDGRFRADLLRRFGGQPITLPPLSIRPEDVPAIVPHVAAELAASTNRVPPSFTQPALTVLSAFQWPGNVSDLRSALERILKDLAGSIVRQEDVLPTMTVEGTAAGRMTPLISLREARRRFEREYIATVLEQHQWRMSDAARTLGIERANLYRKARQLGISRQETRTERTR